MRLLTSTIAAVVIRFHDTSIIQSVILRGYLCRPCINSSGMIPKAATKLHHCIPKLIKLFLVFLIAHPRTLVEHGHPLYCLCKSTKLHLVIVKSTVHPLNSVSQLQGVSNCFHRREAILSL